MICYTQIMGSRFTMERASLSPSRRRVLASKKAFTLIELLVVIAIIAILSIVVILTLNPAELLRQSRDSGRLSDLATMNDALSIYSEDVGGSMGTVSTTYLSLQDSSTTCGSQNLLSLPSGGGYRCASSTSSRSIGGQGWIPLTFSSISSGSPLGSLPQDPTNQSSSGLYYTYSTNGSQYLVTAVMESQKYKTQLAQTPLIPGYPEVAAEGNGIALSLLYNPSGLVGYWNFDEGSGSAAQDSSGGGDNGTWSGSLAGMNSTHYVTGKIGGYAGAFDGSTNSISLPTSGGLTGVASAGTIAAWINYSVATDTALTILDIGGTGSHGLILFGANGSANRPYFQFGTGVTTAAVWVVGVTVPVNTWHFVAATWSAAGASIYYDGSLAVTTTTVPSITVSGTAYIGSNGGTQRYMNGDIDDLRVYNRALSAAEVLALYNADK
jgi:prepilin-type N-terminal cleavage/methylation domain-containing protein